MDRKRILVCAGFFTPHIGGLVIFIHQTLKRLAKEGYEIDLLTCNTENANSHEELDGINVCRLPCWNLLQGVYPIPKPTPKTFDILVRLLEKRHDAVITFTRFYVSSFLGLIFSKLKRVPLIHSEHGSRHSVAPNRIVDLISRSYDHALGALVIRSASKVVCNCSATAGFLRHLGAKDVIIGPPGGVDLSIFKKKQTNLKDKLGVNNAIVITSISRLVYSKGVQDLISGFPKIRQEVPNAKLVIIGDGPYKQELKRLAQERNREDILFLGERSHEEIAELLNITDVFVSPSYSEALASLPIFEAGAIGVPSVTTDVGGTKEIIKDYETGLIVKPKDIPALANKICELIKNDDLRTRLVPNIQRLVQEKFNWNYVAQFYGNIIESV